MKGLLKGIVTLQTARRIRQVLDEAGHDSWTVQGLPWDEAHDAAVDLEFDSEKEEVIYQALGIGQSSHHEQWQEAIERGDVYDDFVSKENDTLHKHPGSWEITPRKHQRPVKRFYGLDSETLHGWAKLVCIEPAVPDMGTSVSLWLDRDKKTLPELLGVLTNTHALRGAVCVSYNMRYDAESMLKHFIPHIGKEGIERLCTFAATEFTLNDKRYRVHYVPTKILRVTAIHGAGSGDSFSLYDIAQFYPGMRLQDAAQKYLGLAKLSDVDAARLNEEPVYWKGREQAIERYCRQDAKLCAMLSKFMSDKVWELWQVDFQSPYSPAQVSQKLFLKESAVMHPIKNMNIAQKVYNSYYGGRIECRMRGAFKQGYLVDIKSAYIWSMVDLPDTKGVWSETKGESAMLEHTPYAFVQATVRTDVQEDGWGPLPVRRGDGLLTYPSGRLTGWWPWPEVQWAVQKGLVTEINVHRSVWLDPASDNHQAPFDYLRGVFRQKEQEQDQARKHVIKTCGLGMYGKTAQAVKKLVITEDGDAEVFLGDEPLKRALEPGYLFNPAVAAYVTSRVRTRLMDLALKELDDSVAVFTDSVILTKPLDMHSGKLGGWDRKAEEGPCRVLMSGLYQFKGQRPRARGLPMGGAGAQQDLDYWKLTGRELKFSKPGPLHLHGAMARNTLDMVNRWVMRERRITPNSDQKRRWNGWKTFEDFFSDSWTGKVLTVNRTTARSVERALKQRSM